MTTAAALLEGVQTPRIMLAPAHHSSAGPEVVELAAMAGLYLDPWQQLVIEHAFAEKADGKLSAFEVALIVSRQNGKGSIIEAAELGWLFLLKERLVLHTAHEVKTSAEAFLRIKDLIENCPTLTKRCKKPRLVNGEQTIETLTGQRLRFMARSKGAGRGFTGHKIILDEAYALDEKHMAALFPTLTAVPDPQVWYTSSAPHADDAVLNTLMDRGAAGQSPRLAYFEWSADPQLSLDERSGWAQANPALGYRVTEEFIELERDALDDRSFSRERLGIREDPGAGGVFEEGTWARLTDLESTCGNTVAFALDMPPGRDHVSVNVVGKRDDGLYHLELIAQMPSKQLVGWLTSPERAVQPIATAIDKSSPAGSLIPDLEAAGIEVTSPTLQQLAAACGDFLDAVTDGELRHLGDPLLAAAAKGVTKRDVGDGGFAWARKNTTVDISPIVGGTLALWAFKTNQDGEEVILW